MTALALAAAAPGKSKPRGKSTEGNFGDIEARRASLGVSQAALCREAAFDASAYRDLKFGRAIHQRRTLIRLARALDRLAGAAAPASAPAAPIVLGFYRSAVVVFAGELGADVALALHPPQSASNFDRRFALAGRARQLAFYLTVNAYEVPRGKTARAVGYSKQNASKALKVIEDARESDAACEAMVRKVAKLLTGEDLA